MSNLTEQFVLEPASDDPERVVPLGFFSEEELGLFSLLIRHRRSLPVYLGGPGAAARAFSSPRNWARWSVTR